MNGFVAGQQIQPCMVLHKTTQHGSTCFLNSAQELSNILLNLRTILCLGAAQQIRTLNLPGQNMLQSSVSVTGEFSPNPYLKNTISTYRKDFPLKK
jgi:hypothetical protein